MPDNPQSADEIDITTTPIWFAETILGLRLYWWQDQALTWFENSVGKRVKGSLRTPNGAGKDSVVIAALALWWVSVHKRGRVVITSKDARQIDEQTEPAITRHSDKFAGWKWIERQVETPTGGKIILFTTDDKNRCEGFHRETGIDGNPSNDGPLLLIANEAKSIDEGIFTAFDRCTYDGLLYASSPGPKTGRFYESQFKPEMGFKTLAITLKDCPHIAQERIDDIINTYGIDSPFVRSTLFGEFMDSEAEARFDREGLQHFATMAEAGHERALRGSLEQARATGSAIFLRDDAGWLWLDEAPQAGGEYLVFCDPNTCEQGAGTEERDNTACGVLRAARIDDHGVEHKDQLVAALHWPGGVKWDSDVLAKRIALLSQYYGGCMVVVEANNFGSALMKDLQRENVPLWRRTKIDDVNPNKQEKILGFLSTNRSREHWVQAATTAVREKALVCRYRPACDEFQTFIILPSGRAEAQSGCHDDWVAALGIGLLVRCFSKIPDQHRQTSYSAQQTVGQPVTSAVSKFGSCG